MSRAVVVAAGAVVVWRVTALALLHVQEAPLVIKTLLALVGVMFLVCGLLVFFKMPGETSLLFAWFCICSGLHWGGPLELPSGQLRTGLLFFYLLVSSFLGSALLLQFALYFPRKSRIADKRSLVLALYGPAILAAGLAVTYMVSGSESSLRATAEGLFFVLHELISNLFAVAALALFVSHLFRAGLTRDEKKYIGWAVAGMLTAWLPYLVASTVGVETDPWNLTTVALPISFTIAWFGID